MRRGDTRTLLQCLCAPCAPAAEARKVVSAKLERALRAAAPGRRRCRGARAAAAAAAVAGAESGEAKPGLERVRAGASQAPEDAVARLEDPLDSDEAQRDLVRPWRCPALCVTANALLGGCGQFGPRRRAGAP